MSVNRSVSRVPDASEESILADWQQEPCGERLCRTSAECQAEVPDQSLQTGGMPRMRPGHVRWKSLQKYLGWATQSTAAKAANHQDQFRLPAMRRKIGRPSAVTAVNMA
ncbi:hypothetical protein AVO45_18065 [Ruegeria marisrubri]|uniref:Uncharacterized protein n=1 Tax=Ruegeria marisrubri TaxID=1685379 RepID=A0A0X3UAM7_9RHOB|nr:hypothetical protein AVO45_18065 [Ruegeria marisrubri]